MDKIKWKRLKRMCENEVGKVVSITLSTSEAMDGYNALAQFNMGRVDVFINGNVCKSIDEIIDVLAHEIAHVTIGDSQHGNEHGLKWVELRGKFGTEYKNGSKGS